MLLIIIKIIYYWIQTFISVQKPIILCFLLRLEALRSSCSNMVSRWFPMISFSFSISNQDLFPNIIVIDIGRLCFKVRLVDLSSFPDMRDLFHFIIMFPTCFEWFGKRIKNKAKIINELFNFIKFHSTHSSGVRHDGVTCSDGVHLGGETWLELVELALR